MIIVFLSLFFDMEGLHFTLMGVIELFFEFIAWYFQWGQEWDEEVNRYATPYKYYSPPPQPVQQPLPCRENRYYPQTRYFTDEEVTDRARYVGFGTEAPEHPKPITLKQENSNDRDGTRSSPAAP